MRSWLNTLIFTGIAILSLGSVRAQETTATILGTVKDVSGAVMPNVPVTATNIQTNLARKAASDTSGTYKIEFLPLGTYRVEVDAPGFKKFVQTGIALELHRDARVDPVLTPGETVETITVNSDAPLVNTNDSSIGRTVANSEIINLPLVNRNAYTLLTLTAGVESSQSTADNGFPEQKTFINGGSNGGVGSTNYYLDGGANMTSFRNTGNVVPNPDAILEFRVITNGYDVEYGRFASGLVEVVTKSGTNELHGSLFEFIRNDKLNALPWGALFNAPLRRNQFGGSIGGPIRKDRTFFFGSYSGTRQRLTLFESTAIVPTSLERIGDFSASASKPIDPLTKLPFPGGIIPGYRLDPAATKILAQYVPLANLPGQGVQAQSPNPMDTDEGLLHIDHALTTKHQLTGTYYITKGENNEPFVGALGNPASTAANLPYSRRDNQWTQQNGIIGDTWLIGPGTINEFHLTTMRNLVSRVLTPPISLGDFGSKFAIQGPPALPQITVSGYFALGMASGGPATGSAYYGARDVLSYTRGQHSFKFGGEVSLEKVTQDVTLSNYGAFTFDGSTSGNALADYLLGAPRTMTQNVPINLSNSSWYTALFVEDYYRIYPRLTLNLGLRYDLQQPYKDPQNRMLTFVPGVSSRVVPSAPTGVLFPGDPGVGRGIVAADKDNFGPRVGLAWDPFGDGKTSVRAGFGVFYGSISGNSWNFSAQGQPFEGILQLTNPTSLSNPYGTLPGGVSPFPYSYDPASPRFIAPIQVGGPSLDFRWPYTLQSNFSVQRQVRKDVSVTVAYVGSAGRHLPFSVDANYPIPGPGATAANVNARRPYLPGTLAVVSLYKSIMNSSYNGLQTTVEKRLGSGFLLKGFYTFSKSLSGAELDGITLGGSPQDMRNLAVERGRTDYDHRQNVVVSLVWELGLPIRQPILRNVVNGWALSAIGTFQSGAPFSILAGRDTNFDGNNTDRANLTGNPHLDPHRAEDQVLAEWFNTAAFTFSVPGQDGTSGRNILDAPGLKNIDLGLFRNFKIRERIQLQARAEATNAFNIVNLNIPNNTLTSPGFGTITSAGPMRNIQLGLRLTF